MAASPVVPAPPSCGSPMYAGPMPPGSPRSDGGGALSADAPRSPAIQRRSLSRGRSLKSLPRLADDGGDSGKQQPRRGPSQPPDPGLAVMKSSKSASDLRFHRALSRGNLAMDAPPPPSDERAPRDPDIAQQHFPESPLSSSFLGRALNSVRSVLKQSSRGDQGIMAAHRPVDMEAAFERPQTSDPQRRPVDEVGNPMASISTAQLARMISSSGGHRAVSFTMGQRPPRADVGATPK